MEIERIKEKLITKQGDDFIGYIDANFVYPDETVSVRLYEIDNNVSKLKGLTVVEKAILLGKLEMIIQKFKATNIALVLITVFIAVITDYGKIIELIINKIWDDASSKMFSLSITIIAVLAILGYLASHFDKSRRNMLTSCYFKLLLENLD